MTATMKQIIATALMAAMMPITAGLRLKPNLFFVAEKKKVDQISSSNKRSKFDENRENQLRVIL